MVFKKFPHLMQMDITDCGPACLQIVCRHYGHYVSLDHVRGLSGKSRVGTTLLGLSEAAEKLGFSSLGLKIAYQELSTEIPLPSIAYWQNNHFVVIYKFHKNKVYVSDPAVGLRTLDREDFLKHWTGSPTIDQGIVLALQPNEDFSKDDAQDPTTPETKSRAAHGIMLKQLAKYRYLFFQVLGGLLVAGILQLAFPFLTQAIVDVGIAQRNLPFIHLILVAQLFVFLGMITVEVFRSFILMHISSRINTQMLSDFFSKLFRLPIGYFDDRITGDIIQRVSDHNRLESFFTTGTLNLLFSFTSLLLFGAVLAFYSAGVFAIFLIGSVLFVGWILAFIKKRTEFDHRRFIQMSENSEKILELINGMQEIKLNNSEIRKRWEWEYMQTKLFKINLLGLRIENWQNAGSSVINEAKNIFITFYTAKLVLEQELTLGMMLSIAFIIGQLNVPLTQLANFIRLYQDAKLSLDRISDTYRTPDEEQINPVKHIPAQASIIFEKVSFKYSQSQRSKLILENLNLIIPANQITAIVGASGSGKTTLLKLMLKFYEVESGHITVGNHDINDLSHRAWRKQVGVVMQEGFLFGDTIAHNIAVTDEKVNENQLIFAAKLANIHDFIMRLPQQYNTKIGGVGVNISTGQKQRILIARAVYKNPQYIFFDEATSALDAENERVITQNLSHFLKGKTAVIIAHRLSTVRDADQIIVLDKGNVVETGSHEQLVAIKGYYFNLIKNQLELGS